MKVQLTTDELREALRQLRTCGNAKVLMGEVELDVLADECKACEAQPEALSPEEQIRRNPTLAFDDPEPPLSHEEMITELLRWFHRPEDAGGMTIYIPKDHPCGFGGSTVYIPKPVVHHFRPLGHSLPQRRKVQVDLTVTFCGKKWNVSHVPDVVVGESLWLEVHPVDRVVAKGIDAAGQEFVCTLTECVVD